MAIQVKDKVISLRVGNLYDFAKLHEKLYNILWDVLEAIPSDVIIITSLARTKEEDERLNASGIHSSGPPWRAIDIIWRGMTQSQLDLVGQVVNEKWVYDPFRPDKKVVYTNPHGTGMHAHLQVHPLTTKVTT